MAIAVQRGASIVTGFTATNYPGNPKPIIGIRYTSVPHRYVALGAEIVYEPYRFTVPTSKSTGTVKTERKYSSKVIYLAPMLGVAIGKQKRLHVYFVPALGIIHDVNEYQHHYGILTYPDIYYGDTIYVNDWGSFEQDRRFVFRVGVEIQRSFPLNETLQLFAGGGAYRAATPLSENSIKPYLGGVARSPQPFIYSLHTGLTCQIKSTKKRKGSYLKFPSLHC